MNISDLHTRLGDLGFRTARKTILGGLFVRVAKEAPPR